MFSMRRFSSSVNKFYSPGIPKTKVPKSTVRETGKCVKSPCVCLDKAHTTATLASCKEEWTPARIRKASKDHLLMTWGAANPMLDAALYVNKSENIYMYDLEGKKYIDFNAGAMCANLGHTVPDSIVDAVSHQLRTFPYAYPGLAVCDIRAKLAHLLAKVVPGDINTFLFPSTGMESNETAIRLSRMFTGRHKIMSRYRSYHGASVATLSMTGDQRRWAAEAGSNGHVRFMDPFPYAFQWGSNEEEACAANLTYLSEVIDAEGPHTIAAIFVEAVTGTNGILVPPKGYLEGVRELCTKHGILMVCDEVMAGFGRTGKWFSWCHSDIVPDITTAAKGINGAFLPLGMVGVRDHVAEHFRHNPVAIGSTYNSHPVVLASAYAAVQHMIEHDIVGHVARMQPVMQERLSRLVDNHPSVKQARNIGLFGCFDVQKNLQGDFIAKVTEPMGPAMTKFKAKLIENGLITMMRGHTVFTNPPLIITADQINESFDIIEKALPVLDAAMEK